jgi:tetratricopeptide (TPR) repeat protein
LLEAGWYAHYARALVHRAEGAAEKAGAEMSQAMEARRGQAARSPHRQRRAAEVLRYAAQALRERGEPRPGSGNPFGTPADADTAYRWLSQAAEADPGDRPGRTDGQSALRESRALLALAAWYKPQPDAATARRLSGEWLRETGREAPESGAYPLLLVHARAQEDTPAGMREAFQSYDAIRTLVEDKGLELPATHLYEAVLEPAARLGEKLLGRVREPALEKQLARLYAFTGRRLRDNLWPREFDAPRRVFESFRRATGLDETNAEYLVGMAYARINQGEPDLDEIGKWAEEAVRLDGRFPGGYGLRGYVRHSRARRERDPRAYVQNLLGAVEAYQKAIDLCRGEGGRDRQLPIILTNRSAAYLELANFCPEADAAKRLAEQKRYLTRAGADARQAVGLNAHYAPAWDALGNALEDVAWILNEQTQDEKQPYDAAVGAFDRAVSARSDKAKYWVDRGRCQFKRVEYGRQDAGFLDKALYDLETSLKLAPPPAVAAEANYWLGMVYRHRNDDKTAAACFKKATDLEAPHKTRAWAVYALAQAELAWREAAARLKKNPRDRDGARLLREARAGVADVRRHQSDEAAALLRQIAEWQAERALAEAEALFHGKGKAAAAPHLRTARACAEEIRACGAPEAAAYFLGQAFEVEGRWDEALRTYDQALPADPAQASPSHLQLLLARIDLLGSSNLPRGPRTSPEGVLAEADRALRLARQANSPYTPSALAAAGLARIAVLNAPASPLTEVQLRDYRRDAMRQLDQAVQRAPAHRMAWRWRTELGVQHMILKEPEAALRWLRTARKDAPPEFRDPIDDRIRALENGS